MIGFLVATVALAFLDRPDPAPPPAVPLDQQALPGVRASAAAGDPAAATELGVRLATGKGTARDDAQALAGFRRAAQNGDAVARYDMSSSRARRTAAWRRRSSRWATATCAARAGLRVAVSSAGR